MFSRWRPKQSPRTNISILTVSFSFPNLGRFQHIAVRTLWWKNNGFAFEVNFSVPRVSLKRHITHTGIWSVYEPVYSEKALGCIEKNLSRKLFIQSGSFGTKDSMFELRKKVMWNRLPNSYHLDNWIQYRKGMLVKK